MLLGLNAACKAVTPYVRAFKSLKMLAIPYGSWLGLVGLTTVAYQVLEHSILELPTTTTKMLGAIVCLLGFWHFSRLLKHRAPTRLKRLGRAAVMALGCGAAAHPLYLAWCAAYPFIFTPLSPQDVAYGLAVAATGYVVSFSVLFFVEMFANHARLTLED